MENILLPLITGLIITLVFYLYGKMKQRRSSDSKINGSALHLVTKQVQNDKLVVVSNISEFELNLVIEGFRKMYNDKKTNVILRITRLGEAKFAITFPYDIEFDIYCFFINYLNFPFEIKRAVEVLGWATTKLTDCWITEENANKKVMIYLSSIDKDGDNVYLTTIDNLGYKLSFASDKARNLLHGPELFYKAPEVSTDKLKESEFANEIISDRPM